ncbi:MAG: RNA polymerase sigma factor [Bacteroidales bacterium]|nr:RNA polymerase sigma factor [Bacteroidales bacterium]
MTKTDEQRFLSLLQQHKGILRKVSQMYMDNDEDREDLRQEIIIQMWKSFKNFRGESKFSSWMYRVAINTAITFFKIEKKRNNIAVQENLAKHPYEEYDQTKDLQMEIFYKAFQQLKPIEKALIFYYLEGFSHIETGKFLGISEGNTRVKLNRTKGKLQIIIKNIENGLR